MFLFLFYFSLVRFDPLERKKTDGCSLKSLWFWRFPCWLTQNWQGFKSAITSMSPNYVFQPKCSTFIRNWSSNSFNDYILPNICQKCCEISGSNIKSAFNQLMQLATRQSFENSLRKTFLFKGIRCLCDILSTSSYIHSNRHTRHCIALVLALLRFTLRYFACCAYILHVAYTWMYTKEFISKANHRVFKRTHELQFKRFNQMREYQRWTRHP